MDNKTTKLAAETQAKLMKLLAEATMTAFEKIKKDGVTPEMLNAVRENVRYINQFCEQNY